MSLYLKIPMSAVAATQATTADSNRSTVKWAVHVAIVKPGEEVPFKPRVTVDSRQLGFSAWRGALD
jgi:hypothetical protein